MFLAKGSSPSSTQVGQRAGAGRVQGLQVARRFSSGRPVDEALVCRGQAEVGREVYQPQPGGQVAGRGLAARARAAVAEEEYVGLFGWQLGGEGEVGLALQSGVEAVHAPSGVAGAVDEGYLGVGVVDEQAYQLAGGISVAACYS